MFCSLSDAWCQHTRTLLLPLMFFICPFLVVDARTCRAARDLTAVIKQRVAFDCGWRPAEGSKVKPKSVESFRMIQTTIRTRIAKWKAWQDAGNVSPPKTALEARPLIPLDMAYAAYIGAWLSRGYLCCMLFWHLALFVVHAHPNSCIILRKRKHATVIL